MPDTLYSRQAATVLRPGDAPYVAPAAEALAVILEPSPGHALSIEAVHRTLRERTDLYVPFASLKRVLKAAGVRLAPEPGAKNLLVYDVRFTAEAAQ